MTLQEGARLGSYQIVSPLGVGGMGVVYRAKDTRLGRDVALKFLPPDFAEDPERHARFEREAKLLASLNHPHIAVLFGLEHLDGHHALAMELVEGEGLDERIGRGAIPMEEAIAIAVQVADALEAAHEKGIVHRDLKPANVRVRPDGTVKVLDFGLAKSWDEQASSSDLAFSPTITGHHTRAGVILGTAAYMSPEQARGKPVDKRADIWAFGCLVYEMLTGAKTFGGDTVTDVIAAVVTRDPDWGALPPAVTPGVRQALQRCLEKDLKRRFRDIGDARFELEEGMRLSGAEAPSPTPTPTVAVQPLRRSALPWIAAGLGLALAAGFATAYLRTASARPRVVRSYVLPPDKTHFTFGGATGGAVLSPDGTRIVVAATDDAGKMLLWLRPLDSLTAQPLEGTDGGSYPFWSPDSRFVGFFVPGKLKKIDILGGPPQTVCDASSGRGGTWSQESTIVFAPDVYGGLRRVASAGGTSAAITEPDRPRGQTSQRWPVFLPDGRRFIYWAGNPTASAQETKGIYVGTLDEKGQQFLLQADSDALFAPPGYLLYLREQSLMAQPFDPGSLKVKGEAFPVAEDVASPESYRLGRFSVSQDRNLVYLTGQSDQARVVWMNAVGQQTGTVGEPSIVGGIKLSPSGQTLAEILQEPQTKNVDVWLVDLARGVKTRFTFDPGADFDPVWSPDGGRIAWSSNSKGHFDLYAKSSTGAGEPEELLVSDGDKYCTDWSRDGRFLAFSQLDPKGVTGADIWVLPLFGDRKPYPFLATKFNEGNGMFSPDGRWLAYQSNESGRPEIYITPFPQGGGKWQVSQGGGVTASWKVDGQGLYFATPDGRLMEASVGSKGPAVEVGTPHEYSKAMMAAPNPGAWSYAVAPKGDRVLVVQSEKSSAVPLTLVTNWTEGLKR
ncbi:MAG: serine/threonine-protein kinase [Acidobacteriia bacterium]|nr:serine/threonine-protein kinase [Terriglobia bacterium]